MIDVDLLRLGVPGVDALVTTRIGGVSEGAYASLNLGLHVGDEPERVIENRRRAAAALRADLEDLVFMHQVHGNKVVVVDATMKGCGAGSETDAIAETDALVTKDRSIVLCVLVADCAPVLVSDPIAGILGVAHAGWRGTVAGVTTALVQTMCAEGASLSDLIGVIGPAISPGAYEIGTDVAQAFVDAGFEPAIHDHAGHLHADVAGANALSLLYAGLRPENITLTAESSDDAAFFSDRAQRPCGRFGLLARLR